MFISRSCRIQNILVKVFTLWGDGSAAGNLLESNIPHAAVKLGWLWMSIMSANLYSFREFS
jgi:hypothetical protein